MHANEVIALAAFHAIKDPALEARERMDHAGENDAAYDAASQVFKAAKAKSSKGALAR